MAPPSNNSECEAKPVGSGEQVLMDWEAPKAQGLYDPQNEHEACGVGFIVAIDGKRNHKVNKSSYRDDYRDYLYSSSSTMQQAQCQHVLMSVEKPLEADNFLNCCFFQLLPTTHELFTYVVSVLDS